jgi:small GTP-binding protein
MTSNAMTYVQKELTIDKQKIQLNIWDTVGQEKYRSLSKLFFKDTKIVILVYTITSMASFEGLTYWSNLYKETIGDDAILGVVGNKSDLYLEQEVSEEKGEQFAKENGGIFSLISAKVNREQLDNYILKLVKEYLKKNPNLIKNPKNIKLNDEENEENIQEIKAGCCAGEKNKKMIRRYSLILKDYNGVINAVFLGDNSVGKTNIINRIKKESFNPNENHTEQIIQYNYQYNSKKIKLDIIINDVDNEKKNSKEFGNILKSSEMFFLVYDVKNKQSFENIGYWIEGITKVKDNLSKILIYILANKNDKDDGNGNIEMINEGRNYALDNKYLIKSISAKDNEGIMGLIEESVEKYLTIS